MERAVARRSGQRDGRSSTGVERRRRRPPALDFRGGLGELGVAQLVPDVLPSPPRQKVIERRKGVPLLAGQELVATAQLRELLVAVGVAHEQPLARERLGRGQLAVVRLAPLGCRRSQEELELRLGDRLCFGRQSRDADELRQLGRLDDAAQQQLDVHEPDLVAGEEGVGRPPVARHALRRIARPSREEEHGEVWTPARRIRPEREEDDAAGLSASEPRRETA